MSKVFGDVYAEAYDAFYAEKDYDDECDVLEMYFSAGERRVRRVLDLGCGTGAHASRLAARGYEVVGVDLSEPMLNIARRQESPGRLEYLLGDIRSIRLDRKFDAVICMFAVLGYQTTDEDVTEALATVRHHLEPNGRFIFDVWYGPAVESIRPTARTRTAVTGEVATERRAASTLEREAHLCTVSYELVTRRPGVADEATSEVHVMRYFFEDELKDFLSRAALRLEKLAPFPDLAAPLTKDSWNAIGIAGG